MLNGGRMNSKVRRCALAALAAVAILLSASRGEAGPPKGPRLFGIRPLGMGNTFVAVCDDRNALHYNPAGLSQVRRWSVSGVGVYGGVDDEFFKVIGFIQDNEEKFSDVDSIDQEFIDSLAPYDERWVATDASAYADFTKQNVGAGVYTAGRLQFRIDRGVYEPRVNFHVADDIVGAFGAAMDLGRCDLQVGSAMKAIWRRESTRELSAREMADFDPHDVLDDLAGSDAGFAMDLGTFWRREKSKFAGAGVVRNLGFIGGESLDAELDLGGSYCAFQGGGFLRQILVAADLGGIFAEDAIGNMIHVGAEIQARFISLRTGFNQGYPTAGASLSSRVFSLDYAFFGRELGELPGSDGQYLHAVEAKLGF
jgi:hypothetical protein